MSELIKKNAEEWIRDLDLSPLPEEGGWYREVYRSKEYISKNSLPDRFQSKRTFSTSIYYLLTGCDFSAFHRIKQEEIWHFYEGSSLSIHIIEKNGKYKRIRLGRDFNNGECFLAVINQGDLFAAVVDNEDSFSLVGCTVAPGFEFEDFEAPKRGQLLALYPEHEIIIKKLTR